MNVKYEKYLRLILTKLGGFNLPCHIIMILELSTRESFKVLLLPGNAGYLQRY